jgi:anti-sigma-K factor RskA
MNIEEYISSGVLELYVFDQLSAEERLDVERMIELHTEVRQEVFEINKSIGKYAQLNAVATPSGVKEELFKQIKDSVKSDPSSNKPNSSDNLNSVPKNSSWNLLSSLFLLSTLGILAFHLMKQNSWNQEKLNFKEELLQCDSLKIKERQGYAMIQDLRNENIAIAKIASTPKFASTTMYLHTSKKDKFNYLQLNNLPDLAAGQAYQLWALKDGQAPMPLTVFNDQEAFVKVDFVDDTKTYAITIEKAEGATAPTMDNLIGTFSVE